VGSACQRGREALTAGTHVSAAERGHTRTGSARGGLGRGPESELGRFGSPGLFLLFFIFITFAKMLQNTSNQLLNSFKNQLIVLNQ
jgi:hypothetical protein